MATVTKSKPRKASKADEAKKTPARRQLEAAHAEQRKLKAKSNKDKHELAFLDYWKKVSADYNPALPLPDRDFVFHATRKWKLDFAWPFLRSPRTGARVKLAVEIQGGTRMKVRAGHSSADRQANDAEKHREAQLDGWVLLCYTDAEIAAKGYEAIAREVAAAMLKL